MNFHSVFSFLSPSSLLSFSYFCYKRTETERNKTHGKIEKYHGFHHPPPSPSLFPFLWKKRLQVELETLFIHLPWAIPGSGVYAFFSGFILFPHVYVAWRIVACDPHLTEAGSHNTYLTLCFFLTQHCFLGLSLLKCICIVHLFILMMWLHPTAWLHHNDLSILLLVDFILQPQAFVSTCSWAHMITFSAVQAQKWG